MHEEVMRQCSDAVVVDVDGGERDEVVYKLLWQCCQFVVAKRQMVEVVHFVEDFFVDVVYVVTTYIQFVQVGNSVEYVSL